jgi:hypothetical protein
MKAFALALLLFLILEFLGEFVELIRLFCIIFSSILPLFLCLHVKDLIELANFVIIVGQVIERQRQAVVDDQLFLSTTTFAPYGGN